MIELTPGQLACYYDTLAAATPEPAVADPRQFRLQQVVMSPDALDELAGLAAGRGSRVLLVQDDVPYYRREIEAKPLVRRLFEAAGWQLEVVELAGDVHTEPARIDTVAAAIQPGDLVVALGGGVIADITKHGVKTYCEVHPDEPAPYLIVIQSANSVCAYASGMAVVTIDGVKRTLTSRLPDVLLLDGQLLADAPGQYSDGGIGDASVAAVSFADYRLSHLMGLTGWEPRAWEVMEYSRRRFLERDPILAGRDGAGMGATAIDLTACGLAMTVAGESAPLSGLEHVTSHTLDMAAAHHGRPTGNHGSQCALATILSLIAWDKLLEEADISGLDPLAIDVTAEQAKVQAAFGAIDTDGKAWRECWSDYLAKIISWRDHRESILEFITNWPAHKLELRRYAARPTEYVAALAATGHPLTWEEIPTGITEAQARWAFTNARLMRKRTSVADLLGFAGHWNEDFIGEVFATYHQIVKEFS